MPEFLIPSHPPARKIEHLHLQLSLATYHALIKAAGRDEYRYVTAVGYSCVVFGWMTIVACRAPPCPIYVVVKDFLIV